MLNKNVTDATVFGHCSRLQLQHQQVTSQAPETLYQGATFLHYSFFMLSSPSIWTLFERSLELRHTGRYSVFHACFTSYHPWSLIELVIDAHFAGPGCQHYAGRTSPSNITLACLLATSLSLLTKFYPTSSTKYIIRQSPGIYIPS